MQRDVHRSQNRIESYHNLRAAIVQVGGKKQLIGATDLDVAITNQCGRLIATVVIAYNSIVLSALLERYAAAGDQKAITLLRKYPQWPGSTCTFSGVTCSEVIDSQSTWPRFSPTSHSSQALEKLRNQKFRGFGLTTPVWRLSSFRCRASPTR